MLDELRRSADAQGHPKEIAASRFAIQLDGTPLDFEMIARIGSGTAILYPDAAGLARCRQGRLALEQRISDGLPIYGVTTGVGAMKDVGLSLEDLASFNQGLVQAHHFGTGQPLPLSVVRNAMAIRVNTALTGRVGCTVALVDAYLRLLSADVIPVVRISGSIGCADIGLMGQIGAVLTGTGEAMYRDTRLPALVALRQAGLSPFTMAPRDGLAAIGVNAASLASAADAVRSAAGAVRILMAVSVLGSGALGASPDPWKAATYVGTDVEALVGTWLCESARQWVWQSGTHVHDPLSLRMMPQIFGTCFDSLLVAGRTLLAATGRTDDNPSAQSVVLAGGIEDEAAFLPLAVERFEAQVEAIRRLAALEALLAAQAVDLLEDSPGGVARLIFEAVRSRAGFYVADRPLSCEIENIDGRLAADSFLAEVLGEARLQTVDEFFSLHPDQAVDRVSLMSYPGR